MNSEGLCLFQKSFIVSPITSRRHVYDAFAYLLRCTYVMRSSLRTTAAIDLHGRCLIKSWVRPKSE